MNRFNQILIAALLVQAIIAGGIFFGNQPPAAEQLRTALLSADKNEVDRITIDEGDGKQTVLTKADGIWLLPDYHQLPADNSKVDGILARLEATSSGWPVATTASGRDRFKVADDSFQKKVTLSKGDDDLQTLYLGTSPGFRQLHIRRSGEDQVYAVKLNSYDFPSQHSSWLDKTLLQPEADIVSLKGPDFAFNRLGDDWQLIEGEGEAVNDEVDKLIRTLTRLSVHGVEDVSVDDSEYELSISAAGDSYIYRFYKEGSNHYISRDDFNEVFRINQSDYENITGLSATQLVKQADDEEKERDS